MVAFDAGILISLLTPRATERHKKERLEFLVRALHQTRTKILIPTPALSELLVHAPELSDGFSRSSGSRSFRSINVQQPNAQSVFVQPCRQEARRESKTRFGAR